MFKKILPYFIVLLGATILYLSSLNKTPVHLNQDELMFSLNAKSIAVKGTDFYGNRLPFYFWHLGSFWATPVIVYLDAVFLKFLPMTEAAIRMGSVFVGILSIALMMVLAHFLFKKKFLTLLAGFLMATTPALFINSRLLLDNVYPIPFVLLWLLLLHEYLKSKKITYIFLVGLALGIGIHSYHAAKLMMPTYLAITILMFFSEFKKNLKSLGLLIFGFMIPILVFIPWLRLHPDTLLNQVSYIGSLDQSVNVQKGFLGVFNLKRLGFFAGNYITYFSPKILFINGDKSLIHSTGKVGAFLFPLVFLFVFGMLDVFRNKDKFSKLILLGFLTYPIAPALINDPERISRGFIVIPFVILLSVFGARFLLSQKDKIFKILVLFIITLSLLQFLDFLVDYFSSYRVRSYSWFNNDIGGGMKSALRSTKIRTVDKIYLDEYIPFVDLYFNFYEQKLGINAENKWEFYNFKNEDFSKFPPGSIVIVRYDHIDAPMEHIAAFEKIETIREPNGNETFFVYYSQK